MTTTQKIVNSFVSKINLKKKYNEIKFAKVLSEAFDEIDDGVKDEKREPTEYNLYDKDITSFTKNERNLYIKQKTKAKFNSPEEEYEYATKNKKECSKCKCVKKLNEYSGNTCGRDAFDKEGYRLRRPECKDCTKQANKGKNEAKKIAKESGISYEAPEFTKCAMCCKLPKKGDELVFDHCHKTKTFRGYLHNSCNRSIGVLGDCIYGAIMFFNYVNIFKIKVEQDCYTGKLKIIED